ncbi:MAG TPA: serine hydrolase [Verrucomicrobiales bacterium]|nr:serine hydrolase [Verrucomicrobiales bacterium]
MQGFPAAVLLVLIALLPASADTSVSIMDGKWHLNGVVTCRGTRAESLLMNVRMVNATFEDTNIATCPAGFDPAVNTASFIKAIPQYLQSGVRAFTLNLQGGMPDYTGAINSAFQPDGSLRQNYLARVKEVIDACDREGAVVILGCYYQQQDQILRDEPAVRAGVVNAARWVQSSGFRNVVLEIANEFGHGGFDHPLLKTPAGQVELMRLAKETAPGLLVSTSPMGDGRVPESIAQAADFILIHFNGVALKDIPERIAVLRKYGKPIVCNEDDKTGPAAVEAATASVASGASWGFMHKKVNQFYPFTFCGTADDPAVYAALKALTTPAEYQTYVPPPESAGGWRKLDEPDAIRRTAGMDPDKLAALRAWLLASDQRTFAATVIRRGHIVLEVERGNSAKTDDRRVASVSKAICATVLAIASEQSKSGKLPKRMTFDDRAFDFIPWAQPLSDPRKASITVRQLFNHTSGISPEATGSRNEGTWEYLLGHTGDERTAKLAFDPGKGCGYSTLALHHAALVCETVTGKPYDTFAIEALFKPLGIEHWTFTTFDGDAKHGRHASHSMGMPARDLARVGYCMLRGGRWGENQVIPKWFVDETAAPTHTVTGPEMRFRINAQSFSHGWELPARLDGEKGRGLPADARYKPGSGGQLLAFVPSLDLVIARQTGSSGDWAYDEFLRLACAAVVPDGKAN